MSVHPQPRRPAHLPPHLLTPPPETSTLHPNMPNPLSPGPLCPLPAQEGSPGRGMTLVRGLHQAAAFLSLVAAEPNHHKFRG